MNSFQRKLILVYLMIHNIQVSESNLITVPVLQSKTDSISTNNNLRYKDLINFPDDIIYLILEHLDIKILEILGFTFLPNKLFRNIRKDTVWYINTNSTIAKQSNYYVDSNNYINILLSSEYFQKKIFKRVNPFITNVLSNYCKICNYFINPAVLFQNNVESLFFISCNHCIFL